MYRGKLAQPATPLPVMAMTEYREREPRQESLPLGQVLCPAIEGFSL